MVKLVKEGMQRTCLSVPPVTALTTAVVTIGLAVLTMTPTIGVGGTHVVGTGVGAGGAQGTTVMVPVIHARAPVFTLTVLRARV